MRFPDLLATKKGRLAVDGVLGIVSLVPLTFMARPARGGQPAPGQAIPEAIPY